MAAPVVRRGDGLRGYSSREFDDGTRQIMTHERH
jgi:hypothetical protein